MTPYRERREAGEYEPKDDQPKKKTTPKKDDQTKTETAEEQKTSE